MTGLAFGNWSQHIFVNPQVANRRGCWAWRKGPAKLGIHSEHMTKYGLLGNKKRIGLQQKQTTSTNQHGDVRGKDPWHDGLHQGYCLCPRWIRTFLAEFEEHRWLVTLNNYRTQQLLWDSPTHSSSSQNRVTHKFLLYHILFHSWKAFGYSALLRQTNLLSETTTYMFLYCEIHLDMPTFKTNQVSISVKHMNIGI